MKAVAVFPRTKEIGLVDHAPPSLQHPTDVRIRILDVGVCGTDREIAAFGYGTPPTGSEYLVIGHESVGEIVEAGFGGQGPRSGRPRRSDGATPISIDGDRIMRNLQILLGTVNAGRDAFAATVRDLGVFTARWPDAVGRLITGHFKPEGHLKLLAGNRIGIKNVVSFAN